MTLTVTVTVTVTVLDVLVRQERTAKRSLSNHQQHNMS